MKSMTCSRIVWRAVAIVAAMPFLTLHAERQPYDRYQSIVDRQMFGQPPPGFDPTKPPSEVSAREERAKEQELTKEQEQLKSAIHFSMINETPTGETAVGFTDNSDAKNPKHYYLKVGESRDGWTVKEADALKAEMTVVKGEIEVTLTIGGNSANGGTKKTGAVPANGPGNAPAGVRSNLLGGRMGGRSMGSLRERRQLRAQQQAAEKKAAEEEKARLEEEREKERAQREAEKEAEKAEREAEKAEMQKKLKDMAEAIRKQQEEAAAKKVAEGNAAAENGEKEGADE